MLYRQQVPIDPIINVNHIIFDSKKILRTAVLMNSQKSKNLSPCR